MSDAAQRKPGEANPIVQLAILVGIFVLVLNAGFYFLSNAYFDDRVKKFGIQELARLSGARMDFGIFTVVIGGASVLAAMYPRAVAYGGSALAGAASLIAVPFAFAFGVVLPFTLLTVAGAYGVLIWRTLQGSRAAWSCLVAITVVYAVVMLFGAPKIGHLVDAGLWRALIAPGLLGVATAALTMLRGRFREQT
jgi:hypothetical protein